MIREEDLLDAIAKCHGERNPNSNTCIKLAAYYTILDNLRTESRPEMKGYSNASEQVRYDSGSEFCKAIQGLSVDEVLPVLDELMDSVEVLIPKLYNATLRKLREL